MQNIRVLGVYETGGLAVTRAVIHRLQETNYIQHNNPEDMVHKLADFKGRVDTGLYNLVFVPEAASRWDTTPLKPQFVLGSPIGEHCATSLEMVEYAIQRGLKAIMWADDEDVRTIAIKLGAKVITSLQEDLGTAASKAFRELYSID